jgi:hypothetical protein
MHLFSFFNPAAEITDCVAGDVRLVNGTTPATGRVEMCVNGLWASFCNTDFDTEEANIVCGELGYQGLGKLYKCVKTLSSNARCFQVQRRYLHLILDQDQDLLLALSLVEDPKAPFLTATRTSRAILHLVTVAKGLALNAKVGQWVHIIGQAKK